MRTLCEQVQDELLNSGDGSMPECNDDLWDHIDSCRVCRAYRAALCRDDKLLTDYVDAMRPGVSRIEDGVIGQLDRMSQEHGVLSRRLPAALCGRRAVGWAVAAALALGLFLLLGRGETTLYARVMKVIEKAASLHIVDRQLRDGRWEKGAEIWYQRDAGVAETTWREGEMASSRIDDGEHLWTHAAGNDLAQCSRSMGVLRIVTELLQTDAFSDRGVRLSEEDKMIAGVQWRAYLQSGASDTLHIVVWLDAEDRLQAWEKRRLLTHGVWETYRAGTVEYDVTPDPKVFRPDFGPGVRVVEVDTLLDEFFGLDEAIFTREVLGFVFAVHEVARCEGDKVFVVCSLRPGDEMKRQVEYMGPSVWNYGSFSLGSSWRWVDANETRDRLYERLPLGHLYHAGLEVQSVLLIPRGSWPDHVTECELEARVSIRDHGLRKKQTAKGLESEADFKPIAVVTVPDDSVSVAQILEDVYAMGRRLEPFLAFDRLAMRAIPFTDEEMEAYVREHPDAGETREYRAGDRTKRLSHGASGQPSELDREQWFRDRMECLKDLLARRN